ncbi:uncharacterized protein LOC134537451 isoform X2 [Bacillus rossius redtenbacheri]|uniref:uncharacterized protein LOC134537451 isoform X2 n=1 Tax=Bacillus rossius redtenbacheri TaxID=93214 RepID=UPI002FDF0049
MTDDQLQMPGDGEAGAKRDGELPQKDAGMAVLKRKTIELMGSAEVVKQDLCALDEVPAPLPFKSQLARTRDYADTLFTSINKLSSILEKASSEQNKIDLALEELYSELQEYEHEDGSSFPYGVKVKGLHTRYIKDLRLLIENMIGTGLVKFEPTPRNSSFVGICFREEEHLEEALKLFRSKPLGLNLKVMSADEKTDLLPDDGGDGHDPMRLLQEAMQEGGPTNETDYKQQLVWKEQVIRSSLDTLSKVLEQHLSVVVKDRTDDLLFKVEPLRHTELTETLSERYQTFTGMDTRTGRVGLGFRALGSHVPSRVLRSQHMIKVVEVMEEFMLQSGRSLHCPENRKNEPFWVSLAVRSNFEGKVMLIMTIRLRNEQKAPRELEKLQKELTMLFNSEEGKSCNVVSAHVKIMIGNRPDFRRIWGLKSLVERVGDVSVRIHNNTYFWSYPIGVRLLCETIESSLDLTEETVVLELGVNTGIIGMWLSKSCRLVYELDRVEENLMHARSNALMNEIKNMMYIHGSLELSLENLAEELAQYKRIVAVINDTNNNARVPSELRAVQQCAMIEKVVYVMMVNKNCTHNLRALCKPEDKGGEPFVIVKVVPLDITPHIILSEVVVVLARPSVLGNAVETRKIEPVLSSIRKADFDNEPGAKRLKLMNPGRDFERGRNRNSEGLQSLLSMPVKPPPRDRQIKMQHVRKAIMQSLLSRDIHIPKNAAMQVEQAVLSAIENVGLLEGVQPDKFPRNAFHPPPPPPPMQGSGGPGFMGPQGFQPPQAPPQLPPQGFDQSYGGYQGVDVNRGWGPVSYPTNYPSAARQRGVPPARPRPPPRWLSQSRGTESRALG